MNEGVIIIDPSETKRLRECNKQLHAKKLDNLDKIDKFLKRHNCQMDFLKNPHRSIIIKLVKYLSTKKKKQAKMASLANSTKYLEE